MSGIEWLRRSCKYLEPLNPENLMNWCWYHQRVISRSLDEEAPLSERTQTHLQKCPSCQAYHRGERRLIERLVAEAEDQRREPPPFLQSKILTSLDRERESACPEPAALRFGWMTAGLAVLVVLTGIVLGPRLRNPTADSAPALGTIAGSWAMIPEAVPDGQKLIEWSQALERPLETELRSVVSDARTAVRLLAGNFLPERFIAASLGTRDEP